MTPHETVTCVALRATLSAESCARRHLRRVGVHGSPAYVPCGACRVGASITTLLLDGGWDPGASARPAQPRF